jgi:MFS superfamily sulfate permease-like transporter
VLAIFHGIPEASLPTLSVGIVTMALLMGIERFLPRLPAPLIAVAAGIVGTSLLHFRVSGVLLVGLIPKGLPPVTVPDFSLATQLWPGAMGIALMSFTETIAVGRAFAGAEEPPPRANRELLATGLANVGGAFIGAMAAGGGTSQTAVNRLAGARSQLAELVTSGVVLAVMLFLSPLIALMPQATLAAVIIVYSIGLIHPKEFKEILKVRRTEFIWALTAFAGVVLLGTLKGILVAILASLLGLAYQLATPPVYVLGRKPGTNVFRPLSKEYPGDETFPGLLLLRLEGRIFFANAEIIGQKMRQLVEQSKPKIVAIDFSNVPDLEYTALKMLTEGEKKQRERGVSVWLVGLNSQVMSVVQRSSLGRVLGPVRMHFNLELAVQKYEALTATVSAA